MNPNLAILAREYGRAFADKRSGLLSIIDRCRDEVSEILADRYLPDHEKERQIAEARDRLDREIAASVAGATEALEEARSFAAHTFDELTVDDVVRGRVSRALDRGVPPGELLERARELGDVDTLVALRQELPWRVVEGKFGLGELAGGTEEFSRGLDRAIAEQLAGSGGEELGQLLDITAPDSDGIKEARRMAVQTAHGNMRQAGDARLAYAWALKGPEAALAGVTDGGEGGGEGE
jgi:hypothetical protein